MFTLLVHMHMSRHAFLCVWPTVLRATFKPFCTLPLAGQRFFYEFFYSSCSCLSESYYDSTHSAYDRVFSSSFPVRVGYVFLCVLLTVLRATFKSFCTRPLHGQRFFYEFFYSSCACLLESYYDSIHSAHDRVFSSSFPVRVVYVFLCVLPTVLRATLKHFCTRPLAGQSFGPPY